MEEQQKTFKPIESAEYVGFYENELHPDFIVNQNGSSVIRKANGSIIKQYIDEDGYIYIKPCTNRVIKYIKVHRIVCSTFQGLPPILDSELATVNHKDGIKTNNHYTNLEWCSRKYNTEQAWATGLNDHRKERVYMLDVYTDEEIEYESISECSISLKLNIPSVMKRLKCGPNKVWPPGIRLRTQNQIFEYMPKKEIRSSLESYGDSSLNKPILLKWLLTDVLEEYKTIYDLSKHLKMNNNTISNWCNNTDQLLYGSIDNPFQIQFKNPDIKWRQINKDIDTICHEFEKSRNSYRVVVLDRSWKWIDEIYESVADCAKHSRISKTTLSRVLNTRGDRVVNDKRFLREMDYYRLSGKPDRLLF